jgi:hypothetical protein
MNKTIIALAITAALPMAAQADATISGSVEATVTAGGATAIASSVTLASSEVLANGMTAATSITVLGGGTDAGTASLTGDFGTVTFGSGIDDESGARLGDVAGVMGSASTANAVSGVTYSGTVAGLSVAVGHGAVTSMGATMDFNGMTIGAASQEGTSAFGASYVFGDLTVTGGKKSGTAAVITASYSTTVDALTVTASADSDDATSASVAYTLDGITVTAAYDGTDTDLSASYTAGNLTVTANSDSEVTAALDLGNADLALERAAGATTMTYTVAF